jgi:hypothetical protein
VIPLTIILDSKESQIYLEQGPICTHDEHMGWQAWSVAGSQPDPKGLACTPANSAFAFNVIVCAVNVFNRAIPVFAFIFTLSSIQTSTHTT